MFFCQENSSVLSVVVGGVTLYTRFIWGGGVFFMAYAPRFACLFFASTNLEMVSVQKFTDFCTNFFSGSCGCKFGKLKVGASAVQLLEHARAGCWMIHLSTQSPFEKRGFPPHFWLVDELSVTPRRK